MRLVYLILTTTRVPKYISTKTRGLSLNLLEDFQLEIKERMYFNPTKTKPV
jgi:hypothetical protein